MSFSCFKNRNFGSRLKTFVLSVTLVSVTALSLGGCTTGRKGGSSDSVPSPGGGSSVLREALLSELATIDPAKVNSVTDSEFVMETFEGLVRYDDKNQIEPCLAEKWEISPDGIIYTFHLRKGVKFTNGREVNASDIKYSWERALDPKTLSTVAPNYLDGVLGATDVVKGKRKDLAGVEIVDPMTIRITIDRPRAYFLGMLAYPSNFVVCREELAKTDGVMTDKSYIGTGPFILDSYNPSRLITLKANANYWDGAPKLSGIERTLFLNPDTAYSNFEAGNIDITTGTRAHYAQDMAAGKFKEEYRLVPSANVSYLTLDPRKMPELTNKLVRKAFIMAIDRESILKVAYKGVGTIADGLLPPELQDIGPIPAHIPYDPKMAQQLLSQAGYPGGKGFPTIALIMPQNTPAADHACEMIRSDLQKNLGITVNLSQREAGQMIHDQYNDELTFFLSGWVADYPDPQDFLSTLFMSHASLNHHGYKNLEFDKLCEQADATTDHAMRAKLYGQANQILMDDVGVIPLNNNPSLYMIHKNVKGWRHNLCTMLPHTQTTISAN